MSGTALPAAFFERDVVAVARELLGKRIVSRLGGTLAGGRIVEVEAYLGADDPASHAYRLRRTEGNAAIYGPPSTWYVYRSYGVHWCANLVTGPPGRGAAVLLRAVEPLEGLGVMRRRRSGATDRLLCAGPGRLCQALGITRLRLDGLLMPRSPVRILPAEPPSEDEILVTPRIGITRAADWPLRFVIRGSPWASRNSRKA
ncbi:MAG TPA: DNA-3-methyladenine glycosylase [Gemmatimonadales bacterium]|nr:DNA-3-methyladenine glycosylase [Gemmatimonadales bacterium]